MVAPNSENRASACDGFWRDRRLLSGWGSGPVPGAFGRRTRGWRAATSAAEILAFRGQWRELVPYATARVAKPAPVALHGVFIDMCALLRRAARELDDPEIIRLAAAAVPAERHALRDAFLLGDSPYNHMYSPYSSPETGRPAPAKFRAAVKEAQERVHYRGRPQHLAAHCFGLAATFKVEDEIVKRWDPANQQLGFGHALVVARVFARRGKPKRAWKIIEQRLTKWCPFDHAQVAPLILLLDKSLAPLMTPERRERVLLTPRGPEA